MPKPTVTLLATKAKRYNRADLVPGKTFQARPGDVKVLQRLGWATDAPIEVKPAKTYQTTELKPAK